MVYLLSFRLPSENDEHWIWCQSSNIHNSDYPLRLFPEKGLTEINCAPITVLSGANGCGKTTLLRVMGMKLKAEFQHKEEPEEILAAYVDHCDAEVNGHPYVIRYIASDDVFDVLLEERAINSGVNRRMEEISEEYLNSKFSKSILYRSDENTIEQLHNQLDARRMSQSKYIRSRLSNGNIVMHSNGETALAYWEKEIEDKGLYLLDEPENSLSPESQLAMKKYIEDSVRFFGCQFVIATHSPFFLALSQAQVLDMDSTPVQVKDWRELSCIQPYRELFDPEKR